MIWLRLSAAALLVLVLSLAPASADYLEVRRSATIKQEPIGAGRIVEHVSKEAILGLLDRGEQTNGYYHVTSPAGASGWVYRTLVVRRQGENAGSPGTRFRPNERPSGEVMKAHFIDLKQGNATLLEFTCGAVLVDAGGQDQETTGRLLAYLNDFFARRSDLHRVIDTIFITHTHIDHNRALRSVVENFEVHNYVHNGILNGSGRAGAQWMVSHANDDGRHIHPELVGESQIEHAPSAGGLTSDAIDPVKCTGVDPQLRVVAGPYAENPGWSSGAFDNGNNASIVIRVDFGKASFLFPGDLEEDGIETMVDRYKNSPAIDIDVLEVGHHGSHNGTTSSEMAAMTPKLAVISMGGTADQKLFTAWAYGHPRKQAIDLLDQWITAPRNTEKWAPIALGAKNFVDFDLKHAIYGTGWDGTIVVTADSAGHYLVQTEH